MQSQVQNSCSGRTPFSEGLQAGAMLGGLDCAALWQIRYLLGVQHRLPSGLIAPQAGLPALTVGLAFVAIFKITHLVSGTGTIAAYNWNDSCKLSVTSKG